MYSFLKGTVESKKEGLVEIDVGGVGYEVLISSETLAALPDINEKVKLYVYLVVRENEVLLIGFKTEKEKNLFLNLITVSSVGPKTALQIMSAASTASIISSIILGDVKTIASAKGVGKKTAERIVLELKEKFAANFDSNVEISPNAAISIENNSIMSDAVLALVSLGLSKQEAEAAVKLEYKEGMALEELISKALRRI